MSTTPIINNFKRNSMPLENKIIELYEAKHLYITSEPNCQYE